MSKRINDDFNAFTEFLSGYTLQPYTSVQTQIDICKGMHKKLFGLLIFNAEFKRQKKYPDSVLFLEETASDLILSLFCAAQGLYKPAKLQLRCSIENFLKSFLIINTPSIIQEKSVYAVFDSARNDTHFSFHQGNRCIDLLHNDYALLCRTAHGDPAVAHPTSALALLPQYKKSLFEELSKIYIRVVEKYLGALYINFPDVVDSMHPENKKDFLDCIAKATKRDVIKILYDD